jgi:hypothetical protein
MCWRCEYGQLSGLVSNVAKYSDLKGTSMSKINVEEMRQAITEAETQAKLALIAYSLLSEIDNIQRRREWEQTKKTPPAPREPKIGDRLKIDGHLLKIVDVLVPGPFDPVAVVKAEKTETLSFGTRTRAVEVSSAAIQLNTVFEAFAEWGLKAGATATLTSTLVRKVSR